MNAHAPPKEGNIPLSFIFEGIYRKAASGEAGRVAPKEVEQLKVHLDGALEQLQAIARKVEQSKEGTGEKAEAGEGARRRR